jgi:hypothetical protein
LQVFLEGREDAKFDELIEERWSEWTVYESWILEDGFQVKKEVKIRHQQ